MVTTSSFIERTTSGRVAAMNEQQSQRDETNALHHHLDPTIATPGDNPTKAEAAHSTGFGFSVVHHPEAAP
jgi:hypothetical protein